MKLLGKKENFAIEYEITNYDLLLGYSKVWFGGNSFGTKEDNIYIDSYLLSGLKGILNSKPIDIELPFKKNDIYSIMNDRLNDKKDNSISLYLRNFGTFCDDFTIFSFLLNDEINILWKLHSEQTLFTDINKQKQDVNYFKIKKIEYEALLKNFENIIKNDNGVN